MKFRTRYLINPKFQLIFSGLLIGISFVSAILVGFVIYQLLFANNALFVKYNLHTHPAFLALLAKEKNIVPLAWIISFLSVALFLFFAGVFLSHKMAGPIFALMRELQKIKEGNFTAYLGLRKRDEFKELKIPFNQWVEHLKKMTEEDIMKIEELIKNLNQLITQMKQGLAQEKEIGEVQKIVLLLEDMIQMKEKQVTLSQPQK